MTLENFISRLEGVRRTSRGWVARCASHEDSTPSLAIAQGERGILVRCFAGCSAHAICAALGLRIADLFFDAQVDPEAQRQREQVRRERERRSEADGLKIDRLREAEYLILSARGLDISNWSDEQLDQALNPLADAYELLGKEAPCHG